MSPVGVVYVLCFVIASGTGVTGDVVTMDTVCYRDDADVSDCQDGCQDNLYWGACIHDCSKARDKKNCILLSTCFFVLGLIVGSCLAAIIAYFINKRNQQQRAQPRPGKIPDSGPNGADTNCTDGNISDEQFTKLGPLSSANTPMAGPRQGRSNRMLHQSSVGSPSPILVVRRREDNDERFESPGTSRTVTSRNIPSRRQPPRVQE